MPIKIVQAAATPEYDLRGVALGLGRKTGVLIRQSKKGADLESRESRLRQELLVPVAIALRGEPDGSNVILYDEGSGVSGTKGYDERPQLSRLYMDIANRVIGSIVVARADRLFRDKHFRNVSMFTELAEREHIMLIVPGRTIYDFTNTKDLQAFQREMQESYSYIATQVAYMQDTRRQKIQRGFYGGGILPAPYVIERAAAKERQIPVIYHPWQPTAIALFERFRDYDYILARIARYIEEQSHIFPYPSADDLQRYMYKTLMRRVTGGYTFSSADSIRKYFRNLTLGGYAKIGRDSEGNVLYLANAFEPAVPMDLLGVSYAALTGHFPDGTPFEGKRFAIRTHAKKPSLDESFAMLHGLLESRDGFVFYYGATQSGRPVYACNKDAERDGDGRVMRGKTGIVQSQRVWSVACEDLDRIVVKRLCELAQHDGDLSARIKAFWDRRKSDQMDEAHVLKTQIERAEAQIRRLDKLLTDPAAPLTVEAERRYIESLRETEEDLQRLLRKQAKQQAEYQDPAEIIGNFYYVLSHLSTEFVRLPPESQKRVARQVIRDIKLNRISAHLFLLHIEWQNGIALCPDVALIWRGKGARIGHDWTAEEEAIIRAVYPAGAQIEIMAALPRRGWQSIRQHACTIGLHRSISTADQNAINFYHATISHHGLDAVARLVDDAQQQARLRQVVGELARKTVRGGLSVHWWLPLDAISYAGNATLREDAALLLSPVLTRAAAATEPDGTNNHDADFIESPGRARHR